MFQYSDAGTGVTQTTAVEYSVVVALRGPAGGVWMAQSVGRAAALEEVGSSHGLVMVMVLLAQTVTEVVQPSG